MLPERVLRSAVEAAAGRIAKADAELQLYRDAAREALSSGAGSQTELEMTLRGLMVDAFGSGGYAATQQVGAEAVNLAGVGAVDWGSWQPGDPMAADLVRNGGLSQLLDQSGVTIQGISGSLLDQLGNRIGDGLDHGESVQGITGSLLDIVGDPARAERIAHTETTRATSAATLATYAANGVNEWDWVLSDGACPLCEDEEAANPHTLNEAPPPRHPYCRCSPSPVVESITAANMPEGGSFLDEGSIGALAEEMAAAVTPAVEALPDLTALDDEQLGAMVGQVAENPEQLDQVLAELDRRDEVARAAEAKAAKREAKQAAEAEAKDAEYDRLLESGADPEHAFEQVYGTTVEQQRRDQAIAGLREAGYKGRGLDELLQDQFKDYAARSYLDAEAATNGFMLNKAGRAAGIDPASLFTGPESRARKYASDDLLGYWQDHGRLTVDDFKAGALGGKGRSLGTAYFL